MHKNYAFPKCGVLLEMTGSDLLTPLCARAACHRLPVFLLRPSTEVLQRVCARLSDRPAAAGVVGSNFDPHAPDADLAIERIRQSGARFCLIALGAPRQEIFAARYPTGNFCALGAHLTAMVFAPTANNL